MDEHDFALERRQMVEMQIITRGISNPATIQSMREVPRHMFVPEKFQTYAYKDTPLLIGSGQTISQPYIVALMTQAAECGPGDKVLDVGTGSGYAAAVFSRIVKEVYSVERIPSLAHQAEECFKQLGYINITVKVGDGSLGYPEHAPYDAIVVTAGAPVLPTDLIKQLKTGGRLIIPIGDSNLQKLLRFRKIKEEKYEEETLEWVRFVPLIGERGWNYGY